MSRTDDSGEASSRVGIAVSPNCEEIQISGELCAYGQVSIGPSGNIGDPMLSEEWDTYKDTEIRCLDCDEVFQSREAAQEHLKKSQLESGFWKMGQPAEQGEYAHLSALQFTCQESTVTINGHAISGVLGPANSTMLLDAESEPVVFESREGVPLPPNFLFEQWDEVGDSKSPITWGDGSLRISKRLLVKSIKHLSKRVGAMYDEDQFALYGNYDEPALLTGPEGTIAIAPRIKD